MKKGVVISLCILSVSSVFAQYAVGDGGGFGYSGLGSSGTEVALPIELLYFTAKSRTAKEPINKATTSEKANDFFTIERTADGVNYEVLGAIPKTENRSQTLYYTLTDAEPLKGTSSYRMKQAGSNGKGIYFNLEEVSRDNLTDFTMYPKQNRGSFIIEGANQNSSLTIVNTSGQIVYNTKIVGAKTEIDLHEQENEIFLLKIESENEQESKKIIIIK